MGSTPLILFGGILWLGAAELLAGMGGAFHLDCLLYGSFLFVAKAFHCLRHLAYCGSACYRLH